MKRKGMTLSQRLSLVFAVLLLLCCGASAWLQVRANRMHEQEVVQALSMDLAGSIALDAQLMGPDGLRPDAVRRLFGQLMAVNPSVEVYLLDPAGRITGHAAPPGRLQRDHVDLAPVHKLLGGGMLPVFGDDPRSMDGHKVFSAAPLRVNGSDIGYIYVVLLGEAHDRVAASGATGAVLRTALWSLGLVAGLCLVAGLMAFALITRPLRRLTDNMRDFDIDAAPTLMTEQLPAATERTERDEIAVLATAFRQMAARLGEQWRALRRQDHDRRELFANISHDLRTPLSSLHGYLETLAHKDGTLAPEERQRYLAIALDQSRKVGGLAQTLFELARLEHGFVEPEPENFSLPDLVQDVYAKFGLQAETRGVALRADFAPRLPPAHADLGLIERVLTNLLDNALRHTPDGGDVTVAITAHRKSLEITLSDSGPGIDPDLRTDLFERPFVLGGARREGGLGLRIAHRILQLHDSAISLVDLPGRGAAFRFELPAAASRDPS